ncbi:hypothetical protein BJX63DRAFT_428579 [Aspergillus granulosus]|uniref:BZIP domain-containing protein n=1 Tax=Aspergillus granulosus TaxID=176169 RepID=A0ABR4HWE1_9EURO
MYAPSSLLPNPESNPTEHIRQPQTQTRQQLLQHSSKATPTSFSSQEIDFDYDDDIDIFPTGLTPDLMWVAFSLSTPDATSGPDAGISNSAALDSFDVMSISLPDPLVWSPYESSATASASSTPASTPTPPSSTSSIPAPRSTLSRSSSPDPPTNLPSEDVFQLINTVPDSTGTSTSITTTIPEQALELGIRSNPPLLPKPTPPSTSGPSNTSVAKTRRVSKRQLNTEAARRYRQRKVDRMNQLEEELGLVKKERDQLRIRVSKLVGETEGLKRLLDDKSQSNCVG